MPLLNRGGRLSITPSTSRISLQRGISPLARAELTPQHSRPTEQLHVSSDEHDDGDDDDDELPPYPGIVNVDSVLDQVRETLQNSNFASRQASNSSFSDSNSSDGNHRRIVTVQRGSQASATVRDESGAIHTRLEPNRNSSTSLQSFGDSGHEHDNPWVPSKVVGMASPGGQLRAVESVV